MFLLLESMEHVKSKLNVDQKIIIKKAEKKLVRIAMETLSFEMKNSYDMKILNLLLRIGIKDENIDEKLKDVTESTIEDIFMVNINILKYKQDIFVINLK